MFYFILKCLYLILPGIAANSIVAILRNKFRRLAVPVDFNKTINGKPIFGKHKTWRGFIIGPPVGIIIAYTQKLLYPFLTDLSLYDYSNWLLFGFLMGFGVMLGDLIGSFFKRRASIMPGEPFIPVDQLSSPIGAMFLIMFVYIPPWEVILMALFLAFVAHVIFNHIGYYIGICRSKW